MSDLKNRLESILFAAGKPLKLEELSRLTRERDLEAVRKALLELQQELEQKKGSVMLINEGDEWKLSVREKYLPFIRKIVTKTELPKSVIETLAVVAFKAPVLQSKVIHIRTNKAYKHLDFLEEKGYITREKKGRTKLIKLTQKFFDYFDVPPEKLKQRFRGFEELDKAIEEMETPPEVDLVDEEGHAVELKQYTTEPELEPYTKTPSPVEKYSETVDGLQVYGEKKTEKKEAKEEKHKKKKAKEKEKKKEDEEKEKIEEKPEKEKSEAQKEDKEKKPEEKKEEKPKEEKKKEKKEEKEPKREEKTEEAEDKETEEKEKPEKKHKEKTKKEEKQEEPKKEEPHKQITAEEVREQAKKLAATKETTQEYESEGIFKGEIPKELEQKIEKRAQEIAYGEKKEIPEQEKEELSFEERPAIKTEEKKEIPTKEKPNIQAEKKPQLPQTPKVPKPPKPETKKKKKKKTKEKTLLG